MVIIFSKGGQPAFKGGGNKCPLNETPYTYTDTYTCIPKCSNVMTFCNFATKQTVEYSTSVLPKQNWHDREGTVWAGPVATSKLKPSDLPISASKNRPLYVSTF